MDLSSKLGVLRYVVLMHQCKVDLILTTIFTVSLSMERVEESSINYLL